MKQKLLMGALIVALLLVVSSQAFAGYDREAVVSAMRNNGKLMGALNEAAGKEDYFAAAEALMGIAQSTEPLLSLDPPKGSKAVWKRIHADVIKAAFRGIGACAEEDAAQLKVHIGEIGALIKEGHSTFR